ncbi:hypothetical protein [Telluria beijingensis]|uniref:hypothetical protein n=1 Tax=Telluria beijingensis TaxID=3068633 RepID=UPI0027955C49|nr:hypothetical protein [Massilia sp. REN29]
MSDTRARLEARAQQYQEWMCEEGYRARDPVWDDQADTWDVHVKYEGATLLLVFDVDDAGFVRILMPNFWTVEPEALPAALAALDLANKKCKCAKVHLNARGDDTIAAVEFLDQGDQMRPATLLRYLAMVVNAAKFFAGAMQEQPESMQPA